MPKILQLYPTESSSLKVQLYKLLESNNNEKLHLKINKILNINELTEFKEFITSQKILPFSKLSLAVDHATLQTKKFQEIIKQLNSIDISRVELIFSDKESKDTQDKIVNVLTQQIAPEVSYPLQIRKKSEQGILSSDLESTEFQRTVIANIQKRNRELKERKTEVKSGDTNRRQLDLSGPLGEKIKLKDIIQKQKITGAHIAQFLPIEVQHIETVEQELAQQNQGALQVETRAELHQIQEYTGKLINFEEFSTPSYKNQVQQCTGNEATTEKLYGILKQELFANLPHAIKYLTPDAAEQLAINLPSFVTLNKENLPNGFYLKQTQVGEFILDYDAHLENEKPNPFTPYESDIECQPIYTISLDDSKPSFLVHCEKNDRALNRYFDGYAVSDLNQLTNMWIKYGDEGLNTFITALTRNTSEQEDLLEFLLRYYLEDLPQWDHLYNNKLFFASLERINHYNTEKLAWFKRFLSITGSSRHDLSKTTEAFETFWNELNILCAEQKVSISEIYKDTWMYWTTPAGGNPVVYMERMLHILKNSRNLQEQLKFLNGICLDNYGAYYASRYENFKTIAPQMRLNYNVEEQNEKQFNKNFKLYSMELDQLAENFIESDRSLNVSLGRTKYTLDDMWFVDSSKELRKTLTVEDLKNNSHVIPAKGNKFEPPYHLFVQQPDGSLEFYLAKMSIDRTKDDDYSRYFRFIGRQKTGITLSSLLEQFQQFDMEFRSEWGYSCEYLAILFFVSHERYIEDQPLQYLLKCLKYAAMHKEVILNAINLLNKLYKLDIKLNQDEAVMLFESFSEMNSYQFERLNIDKGESIKKLLTQLEQNKFAVFKLFNLRSRRFHKYPFIYAMDTADYLAKDPLIEATYHDDLLLFSGSINSDGDEIYYHKRFDEQEEKSFFPKKRKTGKKQIDASKLELQKKIMQNLEQVKHYLHEAAIQEKPNNLYYAIQVLLSANQYFTFAKFLKICEEISKIPSFDSKAVNEILHQNELYASAELPDIFTKDNADLKGIMISLIIQLNSKQNRLLKISSELKDAGASAMHAELAVLPLKELQEKLQKAWSEAGVLLSLTEKIYMNMILKTAKNQVVKSAFNLRSKFLKQICHKVENLPDFNDYSDFAKINRISIEAEKLNYLFAAAFFDNHYFRNSQDEICALFEKADFSQLNYELLFSLLSLLEKMPQRNLLPLLQIIFVDKRFIENKNHVIELINLLAILNINCFPSEYLESFSKFFIADKEANDFRPMLRQMTGMFKKDNKDAVLEVIMAHPELTYEQVTQVLHFSEIIENNRDKLSGFLLHVVRTEQISPLLKILAASNKKKQIIEILMKGHAFKNFHNIHSSALDYAMLARYLHDLTQNELDMLHAFYETTPVSADCLLNAFEKSDRTRDFKAFLSEFEKAPFGVRDLKKQFSISEVDRVINKSKDLINDSCYPYQYRKQLMEAFLFVNEIGANFPVYNNKSANELTNAEIKSFFADLKAKKVQGLTPFQNRLLALGLLREAMYRSTGEFPYSTQIISIIDNMLHQGDSISNIDTGQGKSLIDSMKAALLWIDSDRVDITTSSLVDAKRDIAHYGSFFQLLGLPYSKQPISSLSPIEDFQQNGINFSTFSQLSLFFAKAKLTGKTFDTRNSALSLIINESDYTILDDRVIYRFALADGSGLHHDQEWMYYGINEFVSSPEFVSADKTLAGEDIDDLKAYLKTKAEHLKKSPLVVNKFSDAQYLSWLESALVVNYVLKENKDYVIPDEFEKKLVKDTEIRSKVVKVLMKDGRVSSDSTFGNGIHQLLCARLNKDIGRNDFLIEPQNKTIISSNNANLIDYYRAHKGYIWGSSGTVGSAAEIKEQYNKYGFEFSKTEPHQKNRVKFNSPVIAPDEKAQFTQLISRITASESNGSPSIVFCKDIDTAKRLFEELSKSSLNNLPLQLYTGLGKEEDIIANAGKPGMITVTTSVLGRNTDIHYNKDDGLRVWHTYVDSIRGVGQKSGRTGRQGSIGEVNFVLNNQEIHDKTFAQIQEEIDAVGARERMFYEELYNVIGFLFAQVDMLPEEQFIKDKATFLRDSWSEFTSETERRFRNSHSDDIYNEVFMQETLATFKQMMKSALKNSDYTPSLESVKKAITTKSAHKKPYSPYKEVVTVENCNPPVAIAYQLLQVPKEEKYSYGKKESIKEQLAHLFEEINQDNFSEQNAKYLRYLVSITASQEVIVEAHHEFFDEYLKENSLTKIASNQNYLLMFHSLAQVCHQPVVKIGAMRHAIERLFDEYLQTSWFVSSERKDNLAKLKAKINDAYDAGTIIRFLSEEQTKVAKNDIEVNRKSFCKSYHFFGDSRYQSVLGKTLNLIVSLSGKTDAGDLIKELMPLMAEVTDNVPVDDMTLDALKQKATANKMIDKGNATVLSEALSNVFSIQSRQSPGGMQGR